MVLLTKVDIKKVGLSEHVFGERITVPHAENIKKEVQEEHHRIYGKVHSLPKILRR